MYMPSHFEEGEVAVIRGIIADNPLATLVAHTDEGLVANHLPVLFDPSARDHSGSMETSVLIGHVATANDLHRMLADGAKVLLIFHGEDTYVSPNWYPTKPRHHRHVPTWNYQVVHVHGRIFFQHDDKSKRAIVGHLTKHFETATNGDKAWKMADAPADFMRDMVQNIVGFQINIDTVQAKSKLSQNREMEDYDNVANELEAKGLNRLASRMRYPKGDPAAGLD